MSSLISLPSVPWPEFIRAVISFRSATTAEANGADGQVLLTVSTATSYYIQVVGSDASSRWSYTAEPLITGAAQTSNNLSDLASASTARTNLGLGDAATHPASDFDASGAAASAQAAAQTYADRYAGSAAGTASRPLAATDSSVTNSRTPTGSAGGDLTGSYPNPTLAAAGTAGTYTKVTTDSKGRVTSGASLAAGDIPNIAESQVTNLTTDLAAKATTAALTTETNRATAAEALAAQTTRGLVAQLVGRQRGRLCSAGRRQVTVAVLHIRQQSRQRLPRQFAGM